MKFSAIRLDEYEEVEDVAITCDMFRLERMTPDVWWAMACRGDKEVHFDITIRGDSIHVEARDDTIGCIDDSDKSWMQRREGDGP